MAYGLKYTGSKTHQNSDKYEVRIYQNGWTGSSYEIGNIVRLGLSLQGGMSTITAPIIKTSLFLSMIDTPDRGSTKADGTTCVEDGTKYGEWEEFYTNDPTKYKVELRYTGGLIRGSVIWTGFITPDSWGEDLMYAGPINITARDMIGTLSEYEFDLSGQVTITQIIQGAIAKSKTAMALTLLTSECLQNAGNSTSIMSASVSANAFAGKNWYQVLEETLEALGLILRYNGNNGLICTSIRYAASYAIEKGLSAHTPVFVNRTGYRTLDPAVKQIVEVFNPMTEIVSAQDVEADQVLLQDGTWTEEYVPALGPTQRATVPRMQVTNNPEWSGYAGTMPNVQPLWPGAVPANSRPKNMYLPYCTTTNIGLIYHSEEILPPCKVKFTLSKNLNLNKVTGSETFRYSPGGGTDPCADIVIALIRDDDTLYLNEEGEWVENASTRTISDQTEIELPMADGASELRITFQKCHPAMTRENAFVVAGYGNYVGVAMDFESTALENSDVAGEYKTTTIYNAENHVEINRKPVISSVTSNGYSGFLQNVLRYSGSTISDAWRWPGENSAGLPLSVMVHMQLLLFNCSQNGNSVFTGTMYDHTRPVAVPGTNYVYYQRKCALLAGEINCLSGMVESATLREFLDWSEVWGSVNPEWSQKNSSSVGGTSATSTSGTPAGTGGTTTGGGIPDAPSDGNLWGRQGGTWALAVKAALFDSMFELVGEGTEESPYLIHAKLPLYSDGEITAGGVGSGSGSTGTLATLLDVKHSSGNVIQRLSGGDVQTGDLFLKGDSTHWYALAKGNNGQILKMVNGLPSWGDAPATGVTSISVNSGAAQTGAVALTIPTKTSDLTNDSGFITSSALNGYATQSWVNQQGYAYASALSGYLPLSGGTITGNLTINNSDTFVEFKRGSNSGAYFTYRGGSTWKVSDEGWQHDYELYHTGNIGRVLSNYLPLYGGTVDGDLTVNGDLTVRRTLIASLDQGRLTWGGPAVSNTLSPIGAAMCQDANPNRLFGMSPDNISIEYSTDGGSSWQQYSTTDDSKRNLVSTNSTYYIGGSYSATPSVNNRLRVTISAGEALYCEAKKILIFGSNEGCQFRVRIEISSSDSGTSFTDIGEYKIDGWSGWADIPVDFYFGSNRYRRLRLTFYITSLDYPSNSLIEKIRLLAPNIWLAPNPMAADGEIYRFDAALNAYFQRDVYVQGDVYVHDNRPVVDSGSDQTITGQKTFDGESRFIHSWYCPTIQDTANNVGCANKGSRYLINELLVDKIIMTSTTAKIPFYAYEYGTGGQMVNLTMVGHVDNGGNLVMNGEITAGSASDARFKSNIEPLRNAIAVLNSLRPVEFDWNGYYSSRGGRSAGHDIGFVAQEVQPLIPSAVSYIFGDHLRLDYAKLTPYLVSGWQSHEQRIAVLERENSELKMEMQRIRS